MKIYITSRVLFAILAISATVGQRLLAQTPDDPRDFQVATIRWKSKYGRMYVKIDPNTSEVKCFLGNLAAASLIASKALAIDEPGALARVDGRRFLASGLKKSSSLGMLYLLQLNKVDHVYSLEVVRSAAYLLTANPAGIDITALAYNDLSGRIFAIDYRGERLLSAVWKNQGNPPALPGLSTWETVTSFSGDGGLILAYVLRRSDAGKVPRVGVHFSPGVPGGGGPRYYKELGVWKKDYIDLGPTGIAIANRGEASVMGPVDLMGADGPLQIVEVLTQAVVFEGNVVSNKASVTFPSPGLRPGAVYEATGVNGHKTRFTVPVRYGCPVPFATTSIGRVSLDGRTFYSGSTKAHVAGRIALRESLATSKDMQLSLWVGLRDVNGKDPIVNVNGLTYISDPVAIYDIPVQVHKDLGWGVFALPLTIPESGMEGNVLFFQWLAIDSGGQGVAISDVAGTEVFPDAASSGQGLQATRSSSKEPKAKTTWVPVRTKPSEEAYDFARKCFLNSGKLANHYKSVRYETMLKALLMQAKAKK